MKRTVSGRNLPKAAAGCISDASFDNSPLWDFTGAGQQGSIGAAKFRQPEGKAALHYLRPSDGSFRCCGLRWPWQR
jgi:hypothetical protein